MQPTQATSRKYIPPVTSPMLRRSQQAQQHTNMNTSTVQDASQLTDEQFLAWGANNGNAGYSDPSSSYSSNLYPTGMASSMQQPGATAFNPVSNQLVRRNANQQLTRGPTYDVASQDIWSNLADGTQHEWEHIEDDEELEQKAAAAKREAQSKRPPKQIPPFIQKLSSFLDESNTDLIKWSEDGNSFIVLDEDEFAKKLIPELFKHNNYASFVRQLNMYGFHKKVGLSDNSMRASEKKAKSPSEYYNPYFKRGRPELLWLIQKPKNETVSSKRKRGKNVDQDQGSDDETKREPDQDQHHVGDSGGQHAHGTDLVTLPRPEYAALRKEVIALQRSQQQIAQVLTRMRDENQQYYQQAKAFQAQNERHENSINAILTFLATFYNRSLDGHGNLGSMFSHSIPTNQSQANVVDVGDYDDSSQTSSRMPRPARRPLALLPAPESVGSSTAEPVSTNSPTSPRTWANDQRRRSHPLQNQLKVPQQVGKVSSTATSNNSSARSTPEIKQSPNSPDLSHFPESEPTNNDMMSVIHNANASNNNNSPKIDFNGVLRHYENQPGQSPLTPEQRDTILSTMGNNAGLSTSTNNNNAIISPTPPPIPSLEPYHATRDQLDMLQRQMAEQDSKVQDLASRLQPLSPSGSIPGLHPGYSNSTGEPGAFSLNSSDPFDMDSYLNADYFPEYDGVPPGDFDDTFDFNAPAGADDADLFGADSEVPQDASLGEGGRVVGSVGTSSGVQSPAANATTEVEVEDADAGTETPSKRRRLRK